MARRFQVRRDTEAVVDSFTLAEGEPGYKTDTKRFVVGDGTTSGGVELLGGAGGTIIRNTTLVSGANSHWADDGDKSGVNILSVGDRLFVGDAVNHTGNRLGSSGLGTDWVSTRAANYFSKNACGMALSTNRIGWFAGSYTPASESSVVNIGLGAVSLNEGVNSTGRAMYAEYLHKPTGGGGATSGLEIQGGNFTSVMPTPTPYNVGTGAFALYLGAESAHNYVVGDDDTAVTAPTLPCAAAVDIGGGSISASYQRFKKGVIFRHNALWRGTDDGDGSSGVADALMLATGHQIKWHAADSIVGAVIRSDNTAVADQDVGLIFGNNDIKLAGSSEAPIGIFRHIASATNYWQFENSTGDLNVRALGTDDDIGVFVQTKGTGNFRVLAGDSPVEIFRIFPPSGSPVNGALLRAAGSGGAPYIAPLGETNVSMEMRGKGTGGVRLAAGSGTPIALFNSVASADNYWQFDNGTAGVYAKAIGADTNIGLFFQTKGAGGFRVYAGTSPAEVLRFDPGTAAPVNGIIMRAAGSGGAPYVAPLGETNVDLDLRGRGTGRVFLNDAIRLSVASIPDYADDAAASAGGVLVGHVYRTGSIIKVRTS